MNLIRKEESYPSNKYYIVFEDDITIEDSKENIQECKDSLHQCKESLQLCKDSLHNNIDNSTNNIIDNNKKDTRKAMPVNRILDSNKEHTMCAQNKKVSVSEVAEHVISYFNQVCGTSYRTKSSAIQRAVKARLKEGFTEEDFFTVVDQKYKDWGLNPKNLSGGGTTLDILRPSVVFGSKMEEYLQQAHWAATRNNQVKSVRQDPSELSDKVY